MVSDEKRKEWNKKVEEQIKTLEPALSWLSAYAKGKTNSWDENLNIERAMHYIKLAELEMYCLQYPTKEEREREYKSMNPI